MIIKKFLAKTETEAIEMAKKELGSNAVVMNIKKVQPKGLARLFVKSKVEVTAALDENIVYDTDGKSEKKEAEQKSDGVTLEISGQRTMPGTVPDIVADENEDDKNVAAIEEKLDSLQRMLEKQMMEKAKEEKEKEPSVQENTAPEQTEKEKEKKETPEKENDKTTACKELIRKQMIQNEVEQSIADRLIDEIDKSLPKDASLDQILGAIYQKIILMTGRPYLIDKTQNKETKYIFFLGSTGVGKTTTIAKIASKMKLDHKKNIALVTADTYRIAAVEQLKTYANILGVPLYVVYHADELGEMLEELSQYDMCLVDTAGCSHKNMAQMEIVSNLIDQVPISRREIYLVLNAATKYSDLREIADVYSKITDYSLIFTKLDETSSAGVMLNMKVYTDRPLSYVTWGQNVPDDIGKVDAQKMAKELLGGKS